jgi:hypothetical protein
MRRDCSTSSARHQATALADVCVRTSLAAESAPSRPKTIEAAALARGGFEIGRWDGRARC